MDIRDITSEQKAAFNAVTSHPLQSYEWGEFRKKTGVKVVRRGFFEHGKLTSAFQVTFHQIPKTNYTIGYLPKGTLPTQALMQELRHLGQAEKALFIQLEPNVIKSVNGENHLKKNDFLKLGLVQAAHPLFTKYTFVLDLNMSEENLLMRMHQKARYNIKVAKKHNVQVREDNSEKGFESYWKLTEETTSRQKFYAHTKDYHHLQWETFKHTENPEELTSHLFTGSYENKTLSTLLFFVYHDTLYYPYGASSNDHRNVMHSNLTMWEGIRFGMKLGLKKFDMWGALGPNPDQNDPWFGFHNFKEKFGPDHVEFMGSYDLVINPTLYQFYKAADKLRWMYLKLKK